MNITQQDITEFNREANIPNEYYNRTLETFDTSYNRNISKLKKVIECAKKKEWIIFMGTQVGVGKTDMAICVMKYIWMHSKAVVQYWEQSRPVNPQYYKFYHAPILVHRLAQAGINYQREFSDIVRNRVIVLDEVGRENDGRVAGKGYIQDIFWEMHSRGKVILATTPLDAKGFSDMYDFGMIDRIKSRGVFINTTGKSYRLKAKG